MFYVVDCLNFEEGVTNFIFNDKEALVLVISGRGTMFFEEGRVIVKQNGKPEACVRGVFAEWECNIDRSFGAIKKGSNMFLPREYNSIILRK